jgi:hypothetical protein
MFPSLQLEVMERFTAVEEHFRSSRKLKGRASLTAKGLVFVQVYAVYEHTVKETMRIAIDTIVAHSHRYVDLRSSLLSVFLDPELSSLRDVGPKGIWESRLKLFERAVSDQPIAPVATLPMDGTHFRHTHVMLILKALGITRTLTLRRRHLYIIDEVVNNRNFISHGGETAADTGKRYSRSDVWRVIKIMNHICLRLTSIVAEHCTEPSQHCR